MKAFASDAKRFPQVEVKNSPNDRPHLIFKNKNNEIIEQIVITKDHSLEAIVKMLVEKGILPVDN